MTVLLADLELINDISMKNLVYFVPISLGCFIH